MGLQALFLLALRSAWHRRFALSLVVASIALTSFLLLAVERVRNDVRDNFSSAVSGTDLIVGARTGSVQLLLYSVFRIGQGTNTIRYSSIEMLEKDKAVAWVVPLSLGDSHKGFSVVGTTQAYFEHFKYGEGKALSIAQGARFDTPFDAVIGAEVARRLGYTLGQKIILRHGSGELDMNDHADKPFTVVGILADTGTPVDRSVHISLAGMEALHADFIGGIPMSFFSSPGAGALGSAPAAMPGAMPGTPGTGGVGNALGAAGVEPLAPVELKPKAVTAALVGLKSRTAVFSLQRRVAEYTGEPLMGILPGIALGELWDAVGGAERALQVMSVLVGLVSLAGLVSVVVTALEQRRRELAVLRSVGAGPGAVFLLLGIEGFVLSAAGALLGLLVWLASFAILSPWIATRFGMAISVGVPTVVECALLAGVVVSGLIASLLPGWRAYRLSLADGLSPRA